MNEHPPQAGPTAETNAGTVGAPPPVEIVRAPTEQRNGATHDIDLLPTIDILLQINAEDAGVAQAVAEVLPELARAVELGTAVLHGGGRIHYFGAGTSGRLANMDAAELPPTFGLGPDTVTAHSAGGARALARALEGTEDDEASGAAEAARTGAADLAVGLTASGRTPYVAGALRAAREHGARTVLISANPDAGLAGDVDVHIGMATGAEVIAGSTRMKAGTAQKLALNAFSTAIMVRLGYTYSNLMVGLNATNAKLRGRMVTILAEASGADEADCAAALSESGGDTRVALVRLITDVPVDRAAAATHAADGSVREALRQLGAT